MKLQLFLFYKISAAWWSGVKVVSVNEETAITKIRYSWFNQNPFRSVYFACLAMTAELSTGIMAFTYIRKNKLPVSMLLTGMQASFVKKATGKIQFKCDQGAEIRAAIDKCIATKEPATVNVHSSGSNEAGEKVADFTLIWSYKAR
jgi:hypothetical protein